MTNFREHKIEWDDAKVSRLWNYYSRTAPYSEVYFSKLFGKQILKKSGLPLNATIDVLDFGCGPGFIWNHLMDLRADWNYHALDFSKDSLHALEKKAAGSLRFKGAKYVSKLPVDWPGKYFDAVLLLEVVEHLSDEHLLATVREVFRLLKSGGVVVISCPNNEDLSESIKFCPECGATFHEWQHVRTWNEANLTAYLEQCGFRLCFVTKGNFTARRVHQRVLNWVRGLAGRRNSPHMVAVFQKR